MPDQTLFISGKDMPHAFLFDIGNVIIAFDFSRAARRIAPRCRLSVEESLAAVGSLTPVLERGEMTPETFVATASEKIGFSGEPDEFVAAFEDIFELNEPIVALIELLHERGHPLHLLSNTNGIHVPFFESTYPVFDRFTGRIYSHEVGVMKPDPKIYEIAIAKLDLVPGETIYIDDLAANVEAGAVAGLRALHYDRLDHGGLLASLAADFGIAGSGDDSSGEMPSGEAASGKTASREASSGGGS